MRQFIKELKRRKVYRVGMAYLVVAVVVWETADYLFSALDFPGWTVDFVVVVSVLGFPLALVLAWAFEVTPEGVRRTEEAPGEAAGGSAYAWLGLTLVVLAAGGIWYVMAGVRGEGASPESAAAADSAAARTAASDERPSTPRAGERSIAVLPFEPLGQQEPDVFTEGMHDDLLTRLSNISDLKVISRTSVQRYRDTEMTTAEIARELGVTWILEGGVQEMGDQIQVNAQLIDPRTDTHAWAESYRRDLTAADLFDLQSEITKRIARSLEARITARERARVERAPTEDLAAYRLYVQGRRLLDQRTEEEIYRAAEHFRRAIEEDSTYAPAWAGLADARTIQWLYGFTVADSVVPRAREAARRALELDPELAEAHASMGALHVYRKDGPAMLWEFERAAELKPSYAQGRLWLGYFRVVLGRLDEGLPELVRAAQLDPLSSVIRADLALSYVFADSLEKALREARRAEELQPDFAFAIHVVGVVLSDLGRQEEAIEAFRRAVEADPSPAQLPLLRARLAVAHLRAGDTLRAREILSGIEGDGGDLFYPALVRANMGQPDVALRLLRARDFAYHHAWFFRNSPLVEPLRSHPRYAELIRELNVAWGLNPDGSLPDSADVEFEAESDE